ncbi:hypothetical protein D3C71_1957330 [compost metagenome]
MDESDIDISYKNHAAHTGFKFLQLTPKGQCKTNAFEVPVATTRATLYLEADEGISVQFSKDGKNFLELDSYGFIDFNQTVENIYILFTNTTDEIKEIYSYGIIF